ncbi:MAG: undecaprenyldiphospho-muramoylpentapeptide beta-N-acetylglucosaminyltransferase [Bacteroidetes bacterium]|nr:undecaprenyldiphospho-muramoylpentapeptide beta-N-acetylglucosaminyltransferase [Bacteroidota bacterium]
MTGNRIYRFIFAGGGTGGHLYPLIAVAQQIKKLLPEAEILFVGTSNKIEASVVPALGYNFKSIWISGFSRQLTIKNLLFPVKLLVGLTQSLLINMRFKPRVVIGAGSYVAGPVVWGGTVLGSKIMLLEQNSYPGITNRMLDKKADEIHISFEQSRKYFRVQSKLFLSGNPVRINLETKDKAASALHFGLDAKKKTIFITGGSLGAKSLNACVADNIDELTAANTQLIWQTGKLYYEQYKKYKSAKVKVLEFVDDMSAAYSAADLVVARAGATTIAEVAYLGVPVLFVPSPNVAENHQYKNAIALKEGNAAELLEDSKLATEFLPRVVELMNDEQRLDLYKQNIKSFSKSDAAKVIAEHAIRLAEGR